MSVQAPTQFQDSFFQEQPTESLKGLDLRFKRLVGKWKRRGGVLRPWRGLVDSAEKVRQELESLTDKEINRLILSTKAKVTPMPSHSTP